MTKLALTTRPIPAALSRRRVSSSAERSVPRYKRRAGPRPVRRFGCPMPWRRRTPERSRPPAPAKRCGSSSPTDSRPDPPDEECREHDQRSRAKAISMCCQPGSGPGRCQSAEQQRACATDDGNDRDRRGREPTLAAAWAVSLCRRGLFGGRFAVRCISWGRRSLAIYHTQSGPIRVQVASRSAIGTMASDARSTIPSRPSRASR